MYVSFNFFHELTGSIETVHIFPRVLCTSTTKGGKIPNIMCFIIDSTRLVLFHMSKWRAGGPSGHNFKLTKRVALFVVVPSDK